MPLVALNNTAAAARAVLAITLACAVTITVIQRVYDDQKARLTVK